MTLRFFFLFLSLTLSLGAQVTALVKARLIDGSGGPPVEDATVVMTKGRIRAIGPAAQTKTPKGAQVIDLEGKTIIPGIINLHGHVGMVEGLSQDTKNYTRENVVDDLRTYAMYGVTTTTSMGTDLDVILEVRDDQRRGKMLGARVYTAMQGFTTLGGYPTKAPGVKGVAQEVATAAQARARVDRLAHKGADLVKMWVDDHHDQEPKLPPEVYGAIIDQAHKRNLKAFAHVYELSDAKALVDAGIDALAHSVRDTEVDQELIAKLKENEVTYVPTLTREQSTFIYADPPAWLDDPFFRKAVDADLVKAVRTKLKETQAADPALAINKQGFAVAMRNLEKLADAGVRIGFGTDSGPPGRFQGYFAHWEMELMAEAGLTPAQIIQSFSKNAAEALGIEKRFGALAKGHAADLVVLDANPLENIRHTREIHAVYIGGKRFE